MVNPKSVQLECEEARTRPGRVGLDEHITSTPHLMITTMLWLQ